MSGIAASFPWPYSPDATSPSVYSKIKAARSANRAVATWTASLAYMRGFIAGATIKGAEVASAKVVSMSSPIP